MTSSNGLDGQNGAFVPRKLTKRQMSVVRELADGCDIAMVAARRERGVSSVYEIVGRICERWGLDDWREIGPFAVEHRLVDANDRTNPEYPG
jgi:DNA-binding NarL/FixJ family response regulator